MRKRIFVIVIPILILLYGVACNENNKESISNDPAVIAKGEALFNQQCSGCHNFRQDAIGPQLSGITAMQSPHWITSFIKNPQEVINSKDKYAVELYQKYKVVMPSFTALNNEELSEIVAFLNTHQAAEKQTDDEGNSLSDPIKDTIPTSSLVVQLKQIAQIPPSDTSKQLLTRITKLDFKPGTKDLFILDLRGKIYKLQNGKPEVYMDMAKLRPAFINQPGLATGFGSFAFHPGFAKNGLLYTTHSEASGTARADFGYADSIKVTLQWVLTEWKVDNPQAPVFSGKGRELLRINMVSPIHGVQDIRFHIQAKPSDEDYGLLYLGVGEGGAAENGYAFLEHSKEKVWGTVLRINPLSSNSKNGKYGIPASNPFANSKDTNVLKEIYAYGFRNPHRLTWTKDGQLLVGNVGHGNIESLYLIAKGADCGWPIREGSFVVNPYGNLNKVYALPTNDTAYHITYPVAEYDHGEGKAISGGFEYTGAIPALQGKYLFGDIPTGRLFYVNMKDIQPGKEAPVKAWSVSLNGKVQTLRQLCGNNRVDLHFGKDASGEMYILTKPDGKVYKLVGARE
ncbi:c-type cytochrome [Ilyomonas limi]|uniref:C-type cytochrome n=1 Tax=Ilyomonas limi TaxID=2575867 RepID=A0A4U3KVE5_9BACT|nr:PQQ-dependent sugar dehydrogenase [Ilyomonas limi]TKK65544.1 c-type cytochrome [Ilyomonas limi]